MASSLRAVRAVRHRTANGLQAAFGWAQLGDEQKTRESLARLVREEALLSALSRSGGEVAQYALWQMLADAEEGGRRIAFAGEAGAVRPGALAALLAQLGPALRLPRPGTLLIACGQDGVTVCWTEGDEDVRR